jgi:hypothetical protein
MISSSYPGDGHSDHYSKERDRTPSMKGSLSGFFLRSTNRMRKIATRSMSGMMGEEEDGISCHVAGLALFEGW